MKDSASYSLNLAPVVLFVYNRAACTLQTLEHLKRNVFAEESRLFIYSDGPAGNATEDDLRKIREVREVIRKEKWCGEVHIRETAVNQGLADSIIQGVTEIVNRYGKVIVLEDDLLTSVHFLEYMNSGLNFYEFQPRVFQIVGYLTPIKTSFQNESFFLPIVSSLGWGTWFRAWEHFEKMPLDYIRLKSESKLRKSFDLGNSYPYSDMLIRQMETNADSWGVRWWWAAFKQRGISLFPDRTLVAHIGFDPDATHTKVAIPDFNKYWLSEYRILNFPENVDVNKTFFRRHRNLIHSQQKPSILVRLNNKLTKFLSRIRNKIGNYET
jgi:hypothetical protein